MSLKKEPRPTFLETRLKRFGSIYKVQILSPQPNTSLALGKEQIMPAAYSGGCAAAVRRANSSSGVA